MNRIFGQRKAKEPPPTLDEATDRMDKRGTVLQTKIKNLEEQLKGHREQIKRCRPGPAQEAAKRRALGVLKQKRMYENQQSTLMNQQFNVEQTSFAMQSMQDSVQTVQAMKLANKEMKKAFKAPELNINSVENMQDDLADMMDRNQEIQDVLGQSFMTPDDVDEDELMGELDALEDDLANEVGTGAGGVPSYMQEDVELSAALPAAPGRGGPPSGGQGVQEDELGLPAVPQRN